MKNTEMPLSQFLWAQAASIHYVAVTLISNPSYLYASVAVDDIPLLVIKLGKQSFACLN